MSWQDVNRSSLCSGVKECGTNRALSSFPNSLIESEELQSWRCSEDSAIILDAIRRSFLTKSSIAAMFTSVRVDFGRPPLSSSSTSSLPSRNRECHLKRLIGSQPHSHKPCAPTVVFLSQIDRLWHKILWRLCSFPPSMTYKENWVYKLQLLHCRR
jgi:hypothetical protein